MADVERTISKEEYLKKASEELFPQLKFASVDPELFATVAGQVFDKLSTLSEEEYDRWLTRQEGKYSWLGLKVAQTGLLVYAALGRLAQGGEIERSLKNLPVSSWTSTKKK